MKLRVDRKVAVAGAGLALAAGGGGAYAATRDSGPTPQEQRQAIINDVAKRLGVQPGALTDAVKGALKDQVDAAVAAGRLTQAQADAIKSRIDSGQGPGFFGFNHVGRGAGFHGELDAAASYLGLTDEQIDSERQAGKSLAQIATAHGKSVDGLVQALVDAETKELDQAVKDGRLTSAQEQQIVSGLKARITDMVNSTSFFGPRRGHGPWGPKAGPFG
jgi:hypothetical protein